MGKEQKRPKWPQVEGHQQMEKIQGMNTQSSAMYIQKETWSTVTWVELENIMLCEISHTEK